MATPKVAPLRAQTFTSTANLRDRPSTVSAPDAIVSPHEELFGLVSHELRNPLTTVLAAGRRLATPGLVPPAEEETIRLLVREASRLAVLMDDMLILAPGEQRPEFEPVLLQRLLPAVLAKHLENFPVRVVLLEVPADLPVVIGHSGWIDQVLTNYLSNAEKYSPLASTILISLSAEIGRVSVRVLDRGYGIVADGTSKLFAAFHREESTKHLPGLGLGLTLCKRLVELQAGHVWAASRIGGGSEFGFCLPTAEQVTGDAI